jgi:hypothetical protein
MNGIPIPIVFIFYFQFLHLVVTWYTLTTDSSPLVCLHVRSCFVFEGGTEKKNIWLYKKKITDRPPPTQLTFCFFFFFPPVFSPVPTLLIFDVPGKTSYYRTIMDLKKKKKNRGKKMVVNFVGLLQRHRVTPDECHLVPASPLHFELSFIP